MAADDQRESERFNRMAGNIQKARDLGATEEELGNIKNLDPSLLATDQSDPDATVEPAQVPEESLAQAAVPTEVPVEEGMEGTEETGDLMPISAQDPENTGGIVDSSSPESTGEVSEETLTNDIGTEEEGLEGSSEAVQTLPSKVETAMPLAPVSEELPSLTEIDPALQEQKEASVIKQASKAESRQAKLDAIFGVTTTVPVETKAKEILTDASDSVDGLSRQERLDKVNTWGEISPTEKKNKEWQEEKDYKENLDNTLVGDLLYSGRTLSTAVVSAADTIHMLGSIAALADFSDETMDKHRGLGASSLALRQLDWAAENIFSISKKVMDNGYTLSAMYSEALDNTFGEAPVPSTPTYWANVPIAGWLEARVIVHKLGDEARALENLDNVPAFMKPVYQAILDDPKVVLNGEASAGFFAALTSEAAVQFYINNADKPEYAPLVALIGAAAGGTIRTPSSIARKGGRQVKSYWNVMAFISKKPLAWIRKMNGTLKDTDADYKAFVTNNLYASAAEKALMGKHDPEKVAEETIDLIAAAEKDPKLRALVIDIADTLDSQGREAFSDSYTEALRIQEEFPGLELTTANVSPSATARGMQKDLTALDENEAVRVYANNVDVLSEKLREDFALATPEEKKVLREIANKIQVDNTKALLQASLALESTVASLGMYTRNGDKLRAAEARESLNKLKDMHKVLNNKMYDVDPEDAISIETTDFLRTIENAEFTGPNNVLLTEGKIPLEFGKAVGATLKRKLAKDSTLQFALPKAKKVLKEGEVAEPALTNEEVITRLGNGDLDVLQEIKPEFRNMYYTEANQMIKSFKGHAERTKDHESSGDGYASSKFSEAVRMADDDLLKAMEKGGFSEKANQRKMANTYYKEVMVMNWDPKGTATGQLLRKGSSVHFAIKNDEALDRLFENTSDLEATLDMLTQSTALIENPSSTQFGEYLLEKNVDLKDLHPKERETILQSIGEHILYKMDRVMITNYDDPVSALRQFRIDNKHSLDYFPEQLAILEAKITSPDLHSPELLKAIERQALAVSQDKSKQLAALLGTGPMGSNTLTVLGDDVATVLLKEHLDVVDVDGALKATFIKESIRDSIKVDEYGVIDPGAIHDFLDSYGESLKNFDPAVTKLLEDYKSASLIVTRSKDLASPYGIETDPRDISWLAKEIPKIWTSIRTRETLNVNRTNLSLIHAGSFFSNKVLKVDNKSKAQMEEVYSAILSDPKEANRFYLASRKWDKAATVKELIRAERELKSIFGRLGMPIVPIIAGEMTDAQEIIDAGRKSFEEDMAEKQAASQSTDEENKDSPE